MRKTPRHLTVTSGHILEKKEKIGFFMSREPEVPGHCWGWNLQGTLLTVQTEILSCQFGDRTMPAGKMVVLL